jgi:hypothetical protein
MKFILLIVAAIVFVKCAGKFGLRTALQWACLLVVALFPLSLFGGLMLRPAKFLWSTASIETRVAIVGVPLVVFIATVKRNGVGTALAYVLQVAVFLAAVCLIGFGLVLMVMVIGRGGF